MKDWEGQVSKRGEIKMKSPIVMKLDELEIPKSDFPDPFIKQNKKEGKKKTSNLFKEVSVSNKKKSKNKKIF